MHLQSRIIKKTIKPLFQKKVVYLVSAPFAKRDFERFGVKNWIKSGWKVKVFDVTSFVYPKYWEYENGDKISCNFEGLTIFRNINKILSAINSLKKKVVFIDHLNFTFKEEIIRKAACTQGLTVRLKLNLLPSYKFNLNILKLLWLIKNPVTLTYKLILFIKYKIIEIKEKRYFPNYTVVSGAKSILDINNKKTSIIKGHNFDYDIFLKKKNIKLKRKSNYLVFLDEDGPYHSDFIFSNTKPYITKEHYYRSMDLGLDLIAKSLKLNIKIAAHPRSNYEVKKIKYKLPIIKNKTFELIKDAHVVIGHYSTSLQWAVIMKKPIILITTDEIYNSVYQKLIDSTAKVLGKKVLNINKVSRVNNYKNYLNVDNKKYEKYIETYVKIKDTPEKLLWNIIIEHIKNDLFI